MPLPPALSSSQIGVSIKVGGGMSSNKAVATRQLPSRPFLHPSRKLRRRPGPSLDLGVVYTTARIRLDGPGAPQGDTAGYRSSRPLPALGQGGSACAQFSDDYSRRLRGNIHGLRAPSINQWPW